MPTSLRTLLRICMMNGGPQDLPASSKLLQISIVASIVTSFLGYRALNAGINPLIYALAHVALMGAAWYGILSFARRTDRWQQSAIALFGCSAIVNLVALPIYAQVLGTASPGNIPQGPTLLLLLLPLIWEFAVITLIIRETMEKTTGQSVLLTFLMSMAIQLGMNLLPQLG